MHKPKEIWAAERRRDNLIGEQSKCVGGETEKQKDGR